MNFHWIYLGRASSCWHGMIANAPSKVGAFIATLVDLSRNYALAENFYFGALRSYLKLLQLNYFEDLEQEAESFVKRTAICPYRHADTFQYTAPNTGRSL
ncbi:MAG: hypothetical protein R2769_02825 [Saprospiraceae bacterium]